MLPIKLFHRLLKSPLKISNKDLRSYSSKAKKAKISLEKYLIHESVIDESVLYAAAAEKMSVPYISLKGKEIKKDILNLIPPVLAQTHNLVAFEQTTNGVSVATLDPTDLQTIEFISRKIGKDIKIYLSSPSDIKDSLRRYHADLNEDMMVVVQGDDKKSDAGDLKKVAEELPIINIVNSILEHAVFEGASDIHIEPSEKDVSVRYRVDGLLQQVMTLPKKVQTGIVARIKILSKLKIDEHMMPQDGRFKIKIQDEKLSFRVSIIPVYDGEKIVMRLLHEGQKPLTLDQLGFLPEPKKLVESAIKRPHGLILVTGPTGSGKTTTLYSILGILNKPGVNISTIEDPIEYHVKGINQSQINTRAGFTFAGGLRAFLRQDPDIIMVGEIRDKETAEIAIHAAMTGHLVLSTLHTNDAPTTLPRLMDMDVPPFLVAFTANIIVAQRLVRKICEHCREELKLDAKTIGQLEKLLGKVKLLPLLGSQKIKLKGKEKTLQSMTFFRGNGCRRCSETGYKGRIGIYEVMDIDEGIEKKINQRATADEIANHARDHGMITIFQDGIIKAKQGLTTIEEVLRVTRE
jgi:type IV pilus assembly protein PilB